FIQKPIKVNKTIIVSTRLPVKVTKEEDQLIFNSSEGGLATGLGSIYKEENNIWIGWPGMQVEDEDKEKVSADLKSLNLIPVFLEEEDIKGHYEGLSNELLWPVFHYISTYARFDSENWESDKAVNQKFAEAISPHLNPRDTLWIHDYQLLLFPELLRSKHPDISIAFCQHFPYPSHELLRLIPWRKELLTGMLGADLIGFHTFDDVRHFISAATHLLDLHVDANMIRTQQRAVAVEPFPMGIDSE